MFKLTAVNQFIWEGRLTVRATKKTTPEQYFCEIILNGQVVKEEMLFKETSIFSLAAISFS